MRTGHRNVREAREALSVPHGPVAVNGRERREAARACEPAENGSTLPMPRRSRVAGWKPRDQRRTLGGKLSGPAVASAPKLEIVDLRASRDGALLETVYEGLYSEAFPVSEEREDLDALRTGLWGDDERAPVRHFFVGRRDGKVVGLGACEYHRRSSCGLLS